MNAALVVVNFVLVLITGWYAISTYRLLRESQKTGSDIKRLAETSELSLQTLREQIQAQTETRLTVIRAAIRTALGNIGYWKGQNVWSLAAQKALPPQINLVPDSASTAVEYARVLSADTASDLAVGFDNLRYATVELETMREAKAVPPDFYTRCGSKFSGYLESAKQKMEEVEAKLP